MSNRPDWNEWILEKNAATRQEELRKSDRITLAKDDGDMSPASERSDVNVPYIPSSISPRSERAPNVSGSSYTPGSILEQINQQLQQQQMDRQQQGQQDYNFSMNYGEDQGIGSSPSTGRRNIVPPPPPVGRTSASSVGGRTPPSDERGFPPPFPDPRTPPGFKFDFNADPYTMLGVARDASPSEVARAHARKFLEYHPDRLPNVPKKDLLHYSRAVSAINAAKDKIDKDFEGVPLTRYKKPVEDRLKPYVTSYNKPIEGSSVDNAYRRVLPHWAKPATQIGEFVKPAEPTDASVIDSPYKMKGSGLSSVVRPDIGGKHYKMPFEEKLMYHTAPKRIEYDLPKEDPRHPDHPDYNTYVTMLHRRLPQLGLALGRAARSLTGKK